MATCSQSGCLKCPAPNAPSRDATGAGSIKQPLCIFFYNYGQHIPEIFIAAKRLLPGIRSHDDVAGGRGAGGGAKLERPITSVTAAGTRRDEQPDRSRGRAVFLTGL